MVRQWDVDERVNTGELVDGSVPHCPAALVLGSRGPREAERPVMQAGAHCAQAARWEPLSCLPVSPSWLLTSHRDPAWSREETPRLGSWPFALLGRGLSVVAAVLTAVSLHTPGS